MNPKPAAGLPAPDAASAAHSERVAAHLRGVIESAGGSISFARYMHEVLYAPGLGYYSAGTRKFGPGGDFVTAPEISPLFGYVIARQVAPVLDAVDAGIVLEVGAGTGALAVAVLTRLDELGCLPERYLILEVSPDLQARQAALLREQLPQLADRDEWLADVPSAFAGVVIANEVADAIPVERFRIDGGSVRQLQVVPGDPGFAIRYECAPEFLEAAVRRIEDDLGTALPDGYASEVATGLVPWLSGLSAALQQGMILLSDYGVTRREYYAPERNTGWLRCHFRHHAHNDPLVLPGIQDLTAWVDFSLIAETATDAGLEIAGYTTQGMFLLHGGLESELASFPDLAVAEQVQLSGQVKLLTLPAEMGESFKFIALDRGIIGAPSAFQGADRAHLL